MIAMIFLLFVVIGFPVSPAAAAAAAQRAPTPPPVTSVRPPGHTPQSPTTMVLGGAEAVPLLKEMTGRVGDGVEHRRIDSIVTYANTIFSADADECDKIALARATRTLPGTTIPYTFKEGSRVDSKGKAFHPLFIMWQADNGAVFQCLVLRLQKLLANEKAETLDPRTLSLLQLLACVSTAEMERRERAVPDRE